jgi:predicted AlkP superfamily pyrophosphatase or phosphodiesterase
MPEDSMRKTLCALVIVTGVWYIASGFSRTSAQTPPASAARKQLLVIFDGLRPDYVTREVMPNLYAFGQRGIVFTSHHSVFPTVTRVNTSSISTGSYPERHGLLGNSVFFPQVDATRFLDTSDRSQMVRVNTATNGNLLMATTMGEALQSAGKKLLVVSAGSTGSSFLLNHKVSGGAILHMEYALPESLNQVVADQLGPLAKDAPSDVLNRRAVDLFFKVGLPRIDPTVTVLWFTDPDTTAHEKGIGDPETVQCLTNVDAQFKRVLDGLSALGQLNDYDVWVTSDHGFTTHTGATPLQDLLKPFARPLSDGSPRIVSGGDGAIYVRDHDKEDIARIVATLQKAPRVGPIFTAAATRGSLDGWAPGTLSFDVIRWTHDRSGDIMFSPNWTDETNAHGFRGTVSAGGVAGHGSVSPFDVHNTLMAAGPDLKRTTQIATPTANVDLAPTFLTMLGLPVPPSMEGRALREALLNAPAVPSLRVRAEQHTATTADGSYSATATLTTVDTAAGAFRYLDFAKAQRK